MNKQTKSHRKATSATQEEKTTTKNAVAIVKIVPHLGGVSQDSDALVSHGGKQSRKNQMQKVLGPRLRYVKQVSRERTIAWKNTSQTSSFAKVPSLWNLRTGLKKRLQDKNDAPKARNLAGAFTISRKTRRHSTWPQRNGYCRLHQ